MGKIKLTEEDLQVLSDCINNQTEIPEDLLLKLSPGFFEKLRQAGKFDYKELDKYKIPTLEYAGKRPESVILAQAAITGGAVPLQIVRSFNGQHSAISNQRLANTEWRNMIVQGDNLQFLKTCYMNQDPLIKDKVKGKVKLIYIDPPFATKSDFVSYEGAQSYSDKIERAEFIEGLRERLIYMRELLATDGCIFVHLDYRKKHYMKVLMDEVFDLSNFKNEIAVNRIKKNVREREKVKKLNEEFDTILFYSRNNSLLILPPTRKDYKPDRWHAFDAAGFRTGMDYKIFGFKPATTRHWHWTKEKAFEAKRNYEEWEEKYSKTETIGVFWTKFEPILNKIPMLTFNCRPAGDNPAQRFRTASASLPPSKTEKFSKHFFNRAPAKIFSLRKRKFFCFDILLAPLLLRNFSGLTQNCGNASHPQSRFAGQQTGKNSFPPDPLFFLPACFLTLPKFFQKPAG